MLESKFSFGCKMDPVARHQCVVRSDSLLDGYKRVVFVYTHLSKETVCVIYLLVQIPKMFTKSWEKPNNRKSGTGTHCSYRSYEGCDVEHDSVRGFFLDVVGSSTHNEGTPLVVILEDFWEFAN